MCFNENARLGRRARASLWLYLTRHFVPVHCVKISALWASFLLCLPKGETPASSPLHPKAPTRPYVLPVKAAENWMSQLPNSRLKNRKWWLPPVFFGGEIVYFLLSLLKNTSNNLLSLFKKSVQWMNEWGGAVTCCLHYTIHEHFFSVDSLRWLLISKFRSFWWHNLRDWIRLSYRGHVCNSLTGSSISNSVRMLNLLCSLDLCFATWRDLCSVVWKPSQTVMDSWNWSFQLSCHCLSMWLLDHAACVYRLGK